MRRLLGIHILLIMALLLGACPAPTPPVAEPVAPPVTEPEAEPEAEVTTIRWAFWGSPSEVAVHEQVLEAFHAAQDEIRVEVAHTPWSDYFTRMEILFAAGRPEDIPDVMFVGGASTQKWSALGVLEPLNSYIEESDVVDLNDYWPKAPAVANVGGNIYGLSRDVDPNVLYYNKDLFDEAGLSYPDETWTWDDFVAALDVLTVREADGRISRYGLGMEAGKYWFWVAQAGGSIFDDAENDFRNPSRCNLDSPESLRGISFFNDLYRAGYLMPNADMEAQGRDEGVFIAEQVATIIQNASRVSAFVQAGKNFDIAPLPVPEGGQRANSGGGAVWSISAASTNKDAAWRFIEFLQSPEGGQLLYTQSGQIVPVLRSVANSPVFQEVLPINTRALIMEAEAGAYVGNPLFPDWAGINSTIVTPGLQRIWAGEVEPEEAVRTICAQVNAELAELGYPK